MKRMLIRYLRPLIAVIVLFVVSLGIAAYILDHQRLRFPVVEEDPFELKAEFSTAQAVVPGQGQTIRVSGVEVGEIAKAELEDGHAVVTMNILREYEGLIRKDATALLRPKTGLKDMFVNVEPGKGEPAPEGWTMPIEATLPDVNVDEVISMLDADTRDYLRLLVHGAGRGLEGRGRDLREVYRMFEPTHRDLAAVTTEVATRRRELRRLTHSLNLLNTELAGKEDDLAELVQSAAAVLRAYASEDDNISAAVARLPGALRQTTETLQKVDDYARLLGPTVEKLRPAVRALGRANRALRPLAIEATPLLRNDIRPFVRESRPVVRDLRPAARDLARATPNFERVFRVLNRFGNLFANNPNGREDPADPNRQEGFLFYLGWLPHQSLNLFSTADAHGPFRPSLIAASCQTFRSITHDAPASEFLLGLTQLFSNPATCGEGQQSTQQKDGPAADSDNPAAKGDGR
jgi:phospholipid/cholesterol/gamma-HCH transport system substrate-binding protein